MELFLKALSSVFNTTLSHDNLSKWFATYLHVKWHKNLSTARLEMKIKGSLQGTNWICKDSIFKN